MKKKEYVIPALEEVKIGTMGMLAASGSISDDPFSGDAGAPELPGFDPMKEVMGNMGLPF